MLALYDKTTNNYKKEKLWEGRQTLSLLFGWRKIDKFVV